ncbi:Carboxypeptidase S [Vanrija pseudolonga]|uniref:Carboxypeptidase S n=1 Tax=Vanrija pseudolonga TaxID=143232 RepID=A0AAF1BK41_9TREE|nr:Carboxypeptidase S [Vanrija pseudolonga]
MAPNGTNKTQAGGGGGWSRALLLAVVALAAGLYLGQQRASGSGDVSLRPSSADAAAHVCRHAGHFHSPHDHAHDSPVRCPVQPDARDVGGDWNPADSKADRSLAYDRLAGAIRIRTETFDGMSFNASDPSFDVFYDFEAYLRKTFPLFHKHIPVEHVNVHGLLFTWKGTNPALKPIMLMAHQDVVPVNPQTEADWTHPPFDAVLDDEGWVWGRGTTDMKSTLIAELAAAEKLLSEGFVPERTILFSFGFDEEILGQRGAAHLGPVVLERYGRNGIALILDEGFTGVDEAYGRDFARVGLAEKGCLTVKMTLYTAGGHSSRPPPHTGIGLIAALFTAMEAAPGPVKLDAANPLLGFLECAAEHGNMDAGLKEKVRCQRCWDSLSDELAESPEAALFLKTTQAITVVNGGIKYNALPEVVSSLTNYRTVFFETSQTVLSRLVAALTPVAEAHNLTLDAFGSNPLATRDVVRLETVGVVLEPAPITPDSGAAWDLVAGTIRHQWPGSVVVPSAMTAFTDTQWYWDSSPHIYRFAPASMKHILNFHTVDERIHLDAHLSVIRFMYKILRNSHGWKSD